MTIQRPRIIPGACPHCGGALMTTTYAKHCINCGRE